MIFLKEEFIKEDKIEEIPENLRQAELLKIIKEVKNNLKSSYENMNFASGDLIDYYIYKIKAEEAHYANLLKQIKQL